MGYTHYWYQRAAINPSVWILIKKACGLAIKHYNENMTRSDRLVYEYDQPKKHAVTEAVIRFNGCDENGHETFALEREPTGPQYNDGCFNFCKTAYKPYDAAVTACLIIARHYSPDTIKIASDGDMNDWERGRLLVAKACDLVFTDEAWLEMWENKDNYTDLTDFSPTIGGSTDPTGLSPTIGGR